MPSETGHVKNVANLKTLITYLESLGPAYNPSQDSQKIDALKQLATTAEAGIAALTNAQPAYAVAVDNQETEYGTLAKLATKVSNAFAAVAESENHTQSVKSLKQAITGGKTKGKGGANAAKAAADGTPPPEGRSDSQQSYDYRLDNFQQLIKMVEANPKYKPNEAELTINSLTAKAAALDTATKAVDTAAAPVVNARIIRDKALYSDKTGVLDVVKGVKSYLRSVYNATSPQMKYINQLKFRKA